MYLLLPLALLACDQSGTTVPANTAVDLEGFTSEQLAGTDVVRVEKRDDGGQLLEEGFIKNGVKEGTWITYDQGNLKTITNYIDGQLNGLHLELDNQKRLVAQTGYKNGALHGKALKFKFSRPLQEFNYVNGQLNGFYREYFENSGKLRSEEEYKNGKREGIRRIFNSDGDVVMEETYKNDKKVSGGIVPAESE